jgi:DNA helicase-2/ATP-dependent DNA helicase PcrA
MTRARELLYLYGVEKKGIKISQFVLELQKSQPFPDVAALETVAALQPEFDTSVGAAQIRPESLATSIVHLPLGRPLAETLTDLWKSQSAIARTPEEFEKLKGDFLNQLGSDLERVKAFVVGEQFNPPEAPWKYRVGNISQSNIEDFQTCPLRFYFGKVLNLPAPSNPNMVFGSVIHSILEEAGRGLKEGRVISLDELTSSFEKRWLGVSLDDPDRKERLRQRGYDVLKRFVSIQEGKSGRPLELEKTFAIPLRDAEGNEVANIVGRIDRIDTLHDGLEVIDYKTGKQPKDSKNDLQLPIYAMACREIYKKYPAYVTYMYLGDEDPLVSNSCDAEVVNNTKSEIIDIIEQINASGFIATPGYHCRNCSYFKICPAKQD